MKKFTFLFYCCLLLLCFLCTTTSAQIRPRIGEITNPNATTAYDSSGRAINRNITGTDSLQKRDSNADSITIFYRFFDSTRIRKLDSSINNFNVRYPVPPHYVHLGNVGTAARSLLFSPLLKPGFDAGFHAFDIYKLKIEDTKFYQTTRPYTEMGYLLGSKSEQLIDILHTQNITPDFNMAFQYRFINAPGSFKSQNTSHNNFRINGHYQSNNKRYNAYGIFISNKLKASESGGIRSDSLLTSPNFSDRFTIPTRLGGDVEQTRNFFNTKVTTGSIYNESTILFRQQYDLGQKDSLVVNDSTTIKLFYPRVRFQHTFSYSKQSYQFQDFSTYASRDSDYLKYFNYNVLSKNDTIVFNDTWKDITNDFSIISFPEKNNLNQFAKAGIALQNLQGSFGGFLRNYYNVFLSGEYRNRTRNQKWDLEANGSFYLLGYNNGDYAVAASLKRFISKSLGYIELGFNNVNRTPSFVYKFASNYPVDALTDLNKENITRISASLDNGFKNFKFSGEYYLVSNYTYFDNFFHSNQESTLFNVLHVWGEKKFRLRKNINLYAEVHLQQTAGNPPVNIPLIYTNNRIAWEPHPYPNLFLATGLEVKYNSPYKADDYSPITGQFFYQNAVTISNRPEVNAFFNFRIRSFRAFVRAENLNTLRLGGTNDGFTRNNLSAPHYPYPGFWFRIGLVWNFVN